LIEMGKEWAKRLWEPGGTLAQVVRGSSPPDFGLMGIALLAKFG